MLFRDLTFDDRWDRIQRRLGVLGRLSTGNVVTPFKDSGEAFRCKWKAIDEAKKSVLWQTYICKDDNVGRFSVKKLVEAQERGCRTELLYDCGGNITGRRRLVDQLKKAGANVIEYRPMLSLVFPYFFGGMKWECSPGIRNHRKILIVDDAVGFCGGLNIGNEYCGKEKGGSGRFRDTHCSVVGPAVLHLREVCEDTKAPRPWKWSWVRWRQIASAAVKRRYMEGINAKEEYLTATTRYMRNKGKHYLSSQIKRAEEGTTRIMMRMRWKRQRALLCQPSFFSRRDAAATNGGNRSTIMTSDEQTTKPGDQAKKAVKLQRDRWHSMKRRIAECRVRALLKAQAAFTRRVAASQTIDTVLCDAAPVPGAREYSSRRVAVTQVLCSNPHTRDWSIPYAFWQVSRLAHKRLWVTTPYYMPHRKLMRALQLAARRGVDVRILAGSNTTTDPWFMWYASNYITGWLMSAGVRIYEYRGDQVMHVKTVVVDSIWTSIGSYNWDMMSNKNMEVCVCHLDHGLAREMERQFLEDVKVSAEVKYEDYKRRSLWLRFASWFIYMGLQAMEKLTFRTFRDADLSSKIDGLD
ncbi:PLD like domain [Trypanosoma vivax]|nr:PLD like domain [Trypanosoma vivax]